jgi:hypothetical protein
MRADVTLWPRQPHQSGTSQNVRPEREHGPDRNVKTSWFGLATFMHAAGISCSQRLGDLLAGLEPAGEAAAVRLLGAARRP